MSWRDGGNRLNDLERVALETISRSRTQPARRVERALVLLWGAQMLPKVPSSASRHSASGRSFPGR
jgi:hypothetical protein